MKTLHRLPARSPAAFPIWFPALPAWLPAVCLSVLLAGGTAAPPALAQAAGSSAHPNHERGLSADTAYQAGDLDNVNLFNGNLTLTIPVGPRLPVNAGFSWGLTLVYNSNLWDWDEEVLFCDVDGDGQSDEGEIKLWPFAEPSSDFNAGIGWTLSPGRLYHPGVEPYEDSLTFQLLSPDGSLHGFSFEADAEGARHTSDGSYLRLSEATAGQQCQVFSGSFGSTLAPPPPGAVWHQVEYPDGTIQTFDHRGWAVCTEDRWGNALGTFPPANPAASGTWIFEDTVGRTATLDLSLRHGGQPVVTSVTVPRFGEDPLTGSGTTYQFNYTDEFLPRQRAADSCQNAEMLPVDRLDSVTLPDGSRYVFEYMPGDPNNFGGTAGMIVAASVPTGGQVRWGYDRVRFPNPGDQGHTTELIPAFRYQNIGVVLRETFDRPGTEGTSGRKKLGTWTYEHRLNLLYQDPGTQDPLEKITSVTEPDNSNVVGVEERRTTYHYFNLGHPEGSWDYGLPFTTRVTDPQDASRYLSRTVVDESRRADLIDDPPGQTLQASYVRYERDPTTQAGWKRNVRIQQSSTHHYDRFVNGTNDPGHCSVLSTEADGNGAPVYHFTETVRSDWDGFGHYRTQVTDGTVDADDFGPGHQSEDRQETTTAYEHQTGDPWILHMYASQTVEDDPNELHHQQVCFDRTKGVVTRRRVFSRDTSVTPSGNDLVVAYVYDGQGNVESEISYGGDGGGLTGGDLCNLSLTNPRYRIESRYQHGTLRERWISAPGDPHERILQLEDLTLDPATGLVSAARDGAGYQTSYQYDSLGRVTQITPTADAIYRFQYQAAQGTSPARAEVARGPQGGELTYQELTFDGFGRVVKERTRRPDGVTGTAMSQRTITYDALGRKVKETGLLPDGDTSRSTELFYDPLGRLCKQRLPDGSTRKLWYEGIGKRVEQTAFLSPTGPGHIERYSNLDLHGRIQRVLESSKPTGNPGQQGSVSTGYDYDPAGRLEEVKTSADPAKGDFAEASTHQIRSFDYDGRGFLLEECHPEKTEVGSSTAGCVTYGGYDVLGNPSTRTDGGFQLGFRYDDAGRLVQVTDAIAGRLLKEYSYAPPRPLGAGVEPSAGKLVQAKRHNYLPGVASVETDYVVRELYRYGAPEGRLLERLTSVSDQSADGTGSHLFRQSFGYDSLGNLTSQAYPHCEAGSCESGSPQRTVTYGYNQGALVAVDGFASSIEYHANGALAKVVHTNHLEDRIGQDEDWMSRPKNLQVGPAGGGTPIWQTGEFSFDGSGNVTAIGSDAYAYDEVGRLAQAVVHHGGTAHQESYQYDRFGNLTAITTNGTTRSYAHDLRTNRTTELNYAYDSAGNMVRTPSATFAYDALGMVTAATDAGKNDLYVYTPDDERLAALDVLSSPWQVTWTLRGLDMRVLRTYESELTERDGFDDWSWQQDYVYRGSSLLAAVKPQPNGTETTDHFHLDHLGTPRLITSFLGQIREEHKYLPYGEELTNPFTDSEVMKFTSHERDRDPTGFGNDVDYMHARYYLHRTGRFLSPDPILGSPDRPQSWNRYAYVMGSPTNFIDEYGLEISCKNNQGENDRIHCAEKLTVTAKAPPLSLRQSIRSFLAGNGGPGPCDASCQVMRGVAEIRAPVEGLELGVAVVAETALTGQTFSLFRAAGPSFQLYGQVPGRRLLLLPAPRKIDAIWGVSRYRHGGLLGGMEHIMYRHSARSGFANVSRFAEGTTARSVVGFVDEALRYGSVTPSGPSGFAVTHTLGRAIGTNLAGESTSAIKIYVRNGIIQTAFPF